MRRGRASPGRWAAAPSSRWRASRRRSRPEWSCSAPSSERASGRSSSRARRSSSAPFGFYGSILGVVGALAVARPLGTDPWVLFAATTVAAPWVQALSRVRCLVQGCCHGRPALPRVGIRYTHPRSRVTRLAHLAGVPVHPTPLYSILWNVMIGAALARLWSLHPPAHLVVGAYFLLSGVGRFVEEAYRGEPQTAVVARLSVYQWLAAASAIGGAAVTALGAGSPVPPASLGAGALLVASGAGLLCACAYGVDFPGSSRRFSRLA